jgi:hypothetical protein
MRIALRARTAAAAVAATTRTTPTLAVLLAMLVAFLAVATTTAMTTATDDHDAADSTLAATAPANPRKTELLCDSRSMEPVDLSNYPPAPVLWMTFAADTICDSPPLRWTRCSDWRQMLGVQESSPFAAVVPTIASSVPTLVTFEQYRHLERAQQRQAVESNSIASSWWWTQLYRYAFQTDSTALGDLSTLDAMAALLVLVLILRTIKRLVLTPVFRRFGHHAAIRTHGPTWTHHNPDRIDKFAEYSFRLLYHLIISLLGYKWFVQQEPWWNFRPSDAWDMSPSVATAYLYANFPHHPVSTRMAWYYLIQSAYNLDALVSLVELSVVWTAHDPFRLRWSPTVRGDFQEMMLHHVATNLLILGSSRCRLTRIGSMVFFIHDVSDVPVDLSKLAHFVRFKVTTVTCFCAMVGVWCYTRLYLLPFIIYRSVLTQSSYVCGYTCQDQTPSASKGNEMGKAVRTVEGVSPILYLVYRHAFYGLVAFLILLHLVWFLMFLRIFHSLIFKRKVEDLSEHKSGEKEDHQHHPSYAADPGGDEKKMD